jgi:hypothetical protein
LLIQNLSTTAFIYINFTSAASSGTGSIAIPPLGTYIQDGLWVSTELVTIASPTASVPFTAKQGQ